MVRYLLLLALTAPLTQAIAQARQWAWPARDYAEVRLYYYNLKGERSALIYRGTALSESVVNPGGARLNPRQIERLIAATTGSHPEHGVGLCFLPRHAFAFLDREGKPLGYMEICFECSNYRLYGAQQGNFDMAALADLVAELGVPISPKGTTAEEFKRAFRTLQK